MQRVIKTKSIENFLSGFIIAAILFTNLAIENSKYLFYVYSILAVSILFVVFLILKKPQLLKKLLFNKAFLWIILFSIEIFLYGYYGPNINNYSLGFHALNIIFLMLILFILINNENKIHNILSFSCSLAIISISVFILLMNGMNIHNILNGSNISRIGNTAIGNVNTTAVSYIFLLIPIIYSIFIKNEKKYIPIALIGVVVMLLTGSKKSILSIVLLLVIALIGKAQLNNKKFSAIIRIIILISLIIMLCYYNPVLNELIWKRLDAMFQAFNSYDDFSQTSTNLRIRFIKLAFTKCWDKPFFGHGWGSFALMYGYSSLYRTYLYTHNNYAEIIFSFGLFGFILYYWFPALMIKKVFALDYKTNKNDINILIWMYIVIPLFLDFSVVTCYDYIIGYLSFAISYILFTNEKKEVDNNDKII